MDRLFSACLPARKTAGNGITVLAAMLHAHALALFEHHAFESVVVQGVQLHRYGALTPGQRKDLDELIASRDRFEQLFKEQTYLAKADGSLGDLNRSEEHTSELQSLMRISYAVFCLKKKNTKLQTHNVLHTKTNTTYTQNQQTN